MAEPPSCFAKFAVQVQRITGGLFVIVGIISLLALSITLAVDAAKMPTFLGSGMTKFSTNLEMDETVFKVIFGLLGGIFLIIGIVLLIRASKSQSSIERASLQLIHKFGNLPIVLSPPYEHEQKYNPGF